MRLAWWHETARVIGALAAAALVASAIVGAWSTGTGSVAGAWTAVGYFVLGEVLGLVAWLAWTAR